MSDCPVCLIEHDPAIHQATLNVHKWFKKRVRLSLQPVKQGKQRKHRKPVDLLINFANGAVSRRYGQGSAGSGEVRGL